MQGYDPLTTLRGFGVVNDIRDAGVERRARLAQLAEMQRQLDEQQRMREAAQASVVPERKTRIPLTPLDVGLGKPLQVGGGEVSNPAHFDMPGYTERVRQIDPLRALDMEQQQREAEAKRQKDALEARKTIAELDEKELKRRVDFSELYARRASAAQALPPEQQATYVQDGLAEFVQAGYMTPEEAQQSWARYQQDPQAALQAAQQAGVQANTVYQQEQENRRSELTKETSAAGRAAKYQAIVQKYQAGQATPDEIAWANAYAESEARVGSTTSTTESGFQTQSSTRSGPPALRPRLPGAAASRGSSAPLTARGPSAPAAAGKPQAQTLSAAEVKELGFPAGTIVQRLPNGKLDVVSQAQKPNILPKDVQRVKEKLLIIDVAKRQLQNLKTAWAGIKNSVSAGPGGQGSLPTPSGQAYDAAVNAMRNTITGLTRTPGIGSMSDFETRLTQAQIPERGGMTYESTTEQQIRLLDDLLNGLDDGYSALLPEDAPAQQQAAPGGLQPGTEEDGYIFMGGDPADPKNWKKK